MQKLYKIMDKQVANLSVLFTKLYHFHWYVEGPLFYTLHEKFENLYDEVNGYYDQVAERLIIIGGNPTSSLKNYLQLTSLKEAIGKRKALEMVQELVEDLRLLVIEFKEAIVLANDSKDDKTADLFIEMVGSFEKHIWTFSALLK